MHVRLQLRRTKRPRVDTSTYLGVREYLRDGRQVLLSSQGKRRFAEHDTRVHCGNRTPDVAISY